MNIADNLTYLNETKRQLREAINIAFGAELTDADTFRSYVGTLYGLWTPELLFRGGEQGAWYDPSDISTLFQDVEGSTPVITDGDPVGLMLDKSGNGHHATQAVSAARPIYRTDGVIHWLEFDGIDDYMIHNLSLNSASTLIVAAEKTAASKGSLGGLFTVTAAATPIKSNLMLEVSGGSWGTFAGSWRSSGVSLLGNRAVVALTASGGPVESNIQNMYTNGISNVSSTGGYGGDGSPRTYLMAESLARKAVGLFFGGVAVDAVLSGSVRNLAESYLATKSGVVL